jgi:hypothetical protein
MESSLLTTLLQKILMDGKFQSAIKTGNVGEVERLLNDGTGWVEAEDFVGWRPLPLVCVHVTKSRQSPGSRSRETFHCTHPFCRPCTVTTSLSRACCWITARG